MLGIAIIYETIICPPHFNGFSTSTQRQGSPTTASATTRPKQEISNQTDSMFSFLKKKPKLDISNVIKELAKTLPSKYDSIIKQIEEGIVIGFFIEEDAYIKFKLDSSVISRFEDPMGRYYSISGFQLEWDDGSRTCFAIRIGYGLVLGIELSDRSVIFKHQNQPRVILMSLRITYFDSLENSFISPSEAKIFSPNDLYEIEIQGVHLLHLRDLDDGDFVAIDRKQSIYKVTHSPVELVPLDILLEDVPHL